MLQRIVIIVACILLSKLSESRLPSRKEKHHRRHKCKNLHCCQNREQDYPMAYQQGRNNRYNYFGNDCSDLSLKDCTEKDDQCVWDCDEFQPEGKRHGKFLYFDQGKGQNEERELGSNMTDYSNENYKDPGPPRTVTEIMRSNSYLHYGTCGEVYLGTLDIGLAKEYLEEEWKSLKLRGGRMTEDINGTIHDLVKLGERTGHKDNDQGGYDESPVAGTINYPISDISAVEQPHYVLSDYGGQIMADYKRRLTIFGGDGRSQSFSQWTYPYRTYGKLISNTGSCSAALISRRVILTAAHCVYDTGTNQFVFGWTFYPDSIDNSLGPSPGYAWSSAIVNGNWVAQTKNAAGNYNTWSSSRDADWALIRLATSNTGLGWISYGYNSGLSAPENMNTYGYPGDQAWGTRWFQYCTMQTVWSQQFRSTSCDVWPGQSGSEIYKYWPGSGVRIIYGVVSGQTRTYNVYSRITASKFNFICDYIDEGETTVC